MSRGLSLRRRGRALAFFGAAGLAIVGVAGAGSATAGSAPAPPTYQFSSAESAIGVQVALQRNPDFSSLPDPFDAELPDSEAQLNSFGTSAADGHIVNLNGLGGIPGLICLASPALCAAIPINQVTGGMIPSFPPPDPLDAHATYPHDPAAKAPLLGSKVAQAAIDTNGFALDAGAADATAQQYATTTFAREQNIAIPGGLTVGSATTSTSQTAAADGLTTTAVVHLSNIAIGGTALTIDHLTTTSTVVVRPGKPPQDTTSTVLSGVKSAGLNATVDGSGIHINGNGLPANVVAQVQDAVNKTFAAAHIKVALSNVTRTDDANGHTVSAYGLILTYDRDVNNPPPLDSVTVSPQTLGLPCPQIIPPGAGLDPCSGVSFTLNGVYHGQVALGQVGSVSVAQPNSLAGGVPPAGGGAGPGGTSSAPAGTGNGAGPGGGNTPPGSPQAQSSGSPPSGAPVVAGQQRAVANELAGVGHRLAWLFPLFAICVFGLIGRFRTPARLPGPK